MTPPSAERELLDRMADAKKNERHANVAETRYWFDQYKMIATAACKLLAAYAALPPAVSAEPVAEVTIPALPHIKDVEKLQWSEPDARFIEWRNAMPDKHWSKYDLSAVRLGYELGRLAALSERPRTVSTREVTEDQLSQAYAMGQHWMDLTVRGDHANAKKVSEKFAALRSAGVMVRS